VAPSSVKIVEDATSKETETEVTGHKDRVPKTGLYHVQSAHRHRTAEAVLTFICLWYCEITGFKLRHLKITGSSQRVYRTAEIVCPFVRFNVTWGLGVVSTSPIHDIMGNCV